jgi:NAD(P)-dependent dehydrogenase (short-subunit alcohol dehydrogenase family)
MKSPVSVKGKVIIITGAFGLIGKTIAQSFLEQGARVIAADNDQMRRRQFLNECKAKFDAETYIITNTDITNADACTACVKKAVKSFGRIDVLINNAAIDAKFDRQEDRALNSIKFENFPLEQLERSIEVNIKGMFLMTQAVVRQMLKQGAGNIINVASVYSLVAPNLALYDFGGGDTRYKPVDYVITKSVIPNFTRYLATLYARDNIRCNAIAPHGIYNDHEDLFLVNFSKLSPMGRMAGRNELTGPFTFLASDASGYMTGSVLTVDGGWTAW